MLKYVIFLLDLPLLLTSIPRSNPQLSGYQLLPDYQTHLTFNALDRLIKIKHSQLRNTSPDQVELSNNGYDWRISYTDPLDPNSHFITEGTYLPMQNSYQQKSWFIVSYLPGFVRNNEIVKDRNYAPQQIVRNVKNQPIKMGILYYSPAYGQIINLKIPKNNHFFTDKGQPKITTDLKPQFVKFEQTARILQSAHSSQSQYSIFAQNKRLLQQSSPLPTPNTPIRLINMTDFLSNVPGSVIQTIKPPPPPGHLFSQLFEKFNTEITTKLTQQNISFSPFPPFPKDNSTNQIIKNNQTAVSYSSLIDSNATSNNTPTQDTSHLPDVIPIRPMFLPANYQIVSNLSVTNNRPAQIVVVPGQTPRPSAQQPIQITPTFIPSNFYDQPQPRIDARSSIINAFRFLEIGNESHYIIQQVDYNLDQNLVGVLAQLRDQKKSDLKDKEIFYAEFVYLPKTNITNYNIIFKNSTRYVITAIQLPYKLMNYNILSPTQINPLCSFFDNDGNCTGCSSRSYLSAYKICVVVNILCQSYSTSTGDCTACYQSYTLRNGECVIENSPLFIEGCAQSQNNKCVACAERYFLNNGICKVISRLCLTWNSTTGNCLSCYQGYQLANGECRIV